jgi:hypothetical protein
VTHICEDIDIGLPVDATPSRWRLSCSRWGSGLDRRVAALLVPAGIDRPDRVEYAAADG